LIADLNHIDQFLDSGEGSRLVHPEADTARLPIESRTSPGRQLSYQTLEVPVEGNYDQPCKLCCDDQGGVWSALGELLANVEDLMAARLQKSTDTLWGVLVNQKPNTDRRH